MTLSIKAKYETVIMMSYVILAWKKIKPRDSELDTFLKGSNPCIPASLGSLHVE